MSIAEWIVAAFGAMLAIPFGLLTLIGIFQRLRWSYGEWDDLIFPAIFVFVGVVLLCIAVEGV